MVDLGLSPRYRPFFWNNLTDYSPLDFQTGVCVLPRGTAILSTPASSLSGYRILEIDSPGFVLDVNVTCRARDGIVDQEVEVVLEALRQEVAVTDHALLVGRGMPGTRGEDGGATA